VLRGEYMWRIWRIWPQNATRRSELLLHGTVLLVFQKKEGGQGVGQFRTKRIASRHPPRSKRILT
jgi:hypothetical protein